MVVKLCKRNPGAMTAIMEMMEYTPIVDPSNMLGLFSPLLTLDRIGIYGTDIYVLWSDICDKNIIKTLTIKTHKPQ